MRGHISQRHLFSAGLVLSLLLSSAATLGSDTVALNPAHPDHYVVKKGDTLWGIAGRFLNEPWRWNEVWKANPQIENPDLIYPGDRILLVFEHGQPVLRVTRDPHPTIKLSPRVRIADLDTAIPTIALDKIGPFLKEPRVVSEAVLDNAPYIVSLGNEALMARPGGRIFVRGITDPTHTRFSVYRKGLPYVSPDTGEVLGLEALHIGDAILDAIGDPTTLRMTSVRREVLQGDRLLPVEEEQVNHHFFPRAPGREVAGLIISVVEGVTQIGPNDVVVLNLGTRDGIEAGHVMAVYQLGETVIDDVAKAEETDPVQGRKRLELDPERQGGYEGAAQAADDYVVTLANRITGFFAQFGPKDDDHRVVKLPDERAGTVMVFRPFERVSYALVMAASRAMHLNDTVRNP